MKKKIILSICILLTVQYTLTVENCICQWQRMSGINNSWWVTSFINQGSYLFSTAFDEVYPRLYGGVYYSTNNGLNWFPTSLSPSWKKCLALNNNYLYSGGDSLFYTTNYGANWSLTQVPFVNNVNRIATNNPYIYLASSVGVWITTNNGNTWYAADTLYNYSITSIAVKGDTVFAGKSYNGLWRSINKGINWSRINYEFGLGDIQEILIKNDTIYVGEGGSGVYYSTNRGNNWIQTSLNNRDVSALCLYNNYLFAGTLDSGVFISSNNGVTWIKKNQGFSEVEYIWELFVYNNYIFAGTDKGIWRRTISDIIGVKKIYENVPEKYCLLQNYPNPFNSMTNVKWSMLNAGDVKISVFDILGKEVTVLVNQRLQAGTYEVRFDGSGLASGVYYYKIKVGNFRDIKKMILIK